MDHLPRAQKIFKECIDRRVKQIIQESERLSNKYLNSRQEINKKEKMSIIALRQLREKLKILKKAASLPKEQREEIGQFRGMEDREIEELVRQLGQVIQRNDAWGEQEEGMRCGVSMVKVDSSSELEQTSEQTIQVDMKQNSEFINKDYKGIIIKTFQGICCAIAILVLTSQFYKI